MTGNGMYKNWETGNARLSVQAGDNGPIYDYGACTVPQLLFGKDDTLDQKLGDPNNNNGYYDDDANNNNAANENDNNNDLFLSYDDGANPCLQNPYYYDYLTTTYYPNQFQQLSQSNCNGILYYLMTTLVHRHDRNRDKKCLLCWKLCIFRGSKRRVPHPYSWSPTDIGRRIGTWGDSNRWPNSLP
jgi:hypothetical protein